MILDALATASGSDFKTNRLGDVAEMRYRGRNLVLLKPVTFMNLSGNAVRYWMDASKIPLERVLIVSDDIHLPLGTLRIRGKGSHGGHNGLRDIEKVLGSAAYARLRFGVGAEFSAGRQSDHVLSDFSDDEQEALKDRLARSVELIQSYVFRGLAQTMSSFNNV
jgi:PTH1 family peptidyl-tRNA hydrolase